MVRRIITSYAVRLVTLVWRYRRTSVAVTMLGFLALWSAAQFALHEAAARHHAEIAHGATPPAPIAARIRG